jgi:hypothetical protein
MRLFLLLAVTGFAFAQELPCAALLDNLPSSSLEGITSIDATHTIKYVENGPNARSTLHYVKDFVNNRAYLELDVGYDIIYHYQNGIGTVTQNETTEEAPAEEDLVSIREMMEFLEFDMRSIFTKDSVKSCDGQKSYGSLFTGEQVTVSANGEETFLLFDEAGQLLGSASYYSEGDLVLGVLEDFFFEAGLLQQGTVRSYEIKGDEAVLLEESMLEVQSYNQPLDETLFEP